MHPSVRSIARVCDVQFVRGAAASEDALPDLLLEVPHGATRARHFDELRGELDGDYDDGLRDFFFVNTDVGAPELAYAIARGVVAAQPTRSACILTSQLPRTFVDCNRNVDRGAHGAASKAGELTPGLPPWVQDERDRELLLDRYFAYRDLAVEAFRAVCGTGGLGLCVHTYAPRSLDVAVDDDIGATLRREYAPDRIGAWPLRPSVDLITHDPDGNELADGDVARRAEAAYAAAGFDVVRNNTYSLHPVTLAYRFAYDYPGRTLCFEVRRDRLLEEFVPFVELSPRADLVARAAAPLVAAITAAE